MGLKKKFQRIFKRQGNEHVTEFNKDSIQKKFEDFINTTSNLEDKAISLKKKYASHYFHSESYETPLYLLLYRFHKDTEVVKKFKTSRLYRISKQD